MGQGSSTTFIQDGSLANRARDPKSRHSTRSLPSTCSAESRSRSQRKLMQVGVGGGAGALPASQSCYAVKDSKGDLLMTAASSAKSYGDSNILWSSNAAPYYVESRVQKKKGPRSLDISYKASKADRYNRHAAANAKVRDDSWSDVASDMYRLDRRPVVSAVQSKNKQYSNVLCRHSCRNTENTRGLSEGKCFQQEDGFKDRPSNIATIAEDAPLCTFSVDRSVGDTRFQMPRPPSEPSSAGAEFPFGKSMYPPPRPPKKTTLQSHSSVQDGKREGETWVDFPYLSDSPAKSVSGDAGTSSGNDFAAGDSNGQFQSACSSGYLCDKVIIKSLRKELSAERLLRFELERRIKSSEKNCGSSQVACCVLEKQLAELSEELRQQKSSFDSLKMKYKERESNVKQLENDLGRMVKEVNRCEKKNIQQKAAYDRCLDDIAQHVAKALVDQDHLKRECDRLNNRVVEMEWENRLLRAQLQFSLQKESEMSHVVERDVGCSAASRMFSSAIYCNSAQIESAKDVALCSPQSNAGEGLFSRPVSFCLDKYMDFSAMAKAVDGPCVLTVDAVNAAVDVANDRSLSQETLGANDNDYCTDEIKNFSRTSEECTTSASATSISHTNRSQRTLADVAGSGGTFLGSPDSPPFRNPHALRKVPAPTSDRNVTNGHNLIAPLLPSSAFPASSSSSCSVVGDTNGVGAARGKYGSTSSVTPRSSFSLKPDAGADAGDSDICPQMVSGSGDGSTGSEACQKLQVLVHALHGVKSDFPLHEKLPLKSTSLCWKKCVPLKAYTLDDGYSTMSSEVHGDSLPLLYSSAAHANFFLPSTVFCASPSAYKSPLTADRARLIRSCEYFDNDVDLRRSAVLRDCGFCRVSSDSALYFRRKHSCHTSDLGRYEQQRLQDGRWSGNDDERRLLEPLRLPDVNRTWPEDGGEALSEFADNDESADFQSPDYDRSESSASSNSADCDGSDARSGEEEKDDDVGTYDQLKTTTAACSQWSWPVAPNAATDGGDDVVQSSSVVSSVADVDSSMSSSGHEFSSDRHNTSFGSRTTGSTSSSFSTDDSDDDGNAMMADWMKQLKMKQSDSKMDVVRYIPPGIRPSVLRQDVFGRFGTEEKLALASFDFLNYYDASPDARARRNELACELHCDAGGRRRRTRSLDDSFVSAQLNKVSNPNLYENLPFHLRANRERLDISRADGGGGLLPCGSPLCRSRWRSHCSSASSLRSSHSGGSSLLLSDLCAADQTLSSCSSLSFQF